MGQRRREEKGVQPAHPARGLQHPVEECTRPHARFGRERGKGFLLEMLQFLAALTAPLNCSVNRKATPGREIRQLEILIKTGRKLD